ncbi:FAD-dependent oxidoreductase [Naasia sp. SYSU D00057]|uniref:FAD-dependent oxidoreductase n=1 Tax=Naasia sp. SYSU D00057 TaxID=2817380 RepID=UPI001B3125A6|nr:FAD-dependent oxidoreductase [Naasia sp. SYSU D00057]
MSEPTTVAIAGGGPAGVVLGLLLARSGIEVTVLEKHADFLRDFRGDTVHPSTQEILDELGLLDEFQGIVRGRMPSLRLSTPRGPLLEADLGRVRPRAPFHEIAMAPQWDLLELLVRHAERYPSFRLLRAAEVLGPLRGSGGAVSGVRYRDAAGEHELRAVLTVAADGRRSTMRAAIGARLHDFDAPLDVLWFRLPRHEGDEEGLSGMVGDRAMGVAVNRDDYWQVAYLVRAGADAEVRAEGIPAFRRRVAAVLPWTADRVDAITDWDQVRTLQVSITRLRRWWAPGILAIGDAAHTMSPVGGVGINLAVQDAVAAANLLAGPLRRAQADALRFERTLNPALLARVQRRRWLPTVVTQRIQLLVQKGVIARILTRGFDPDQVPAAVRTALRNSPITRVIPSVFAFGVLPEHVRTAEALPVTPQAAAR